MSPNPISRQRRFSFGGVMRRWSDGSGQFSLPTISVPDVVENFQLTENLRFSGKFRPITELLDKKKADKYYPII
jgi:hypothetical protein